MCNVVSEVQKYHKTPEIEESKDNQQNPTSPYPSQFLTTLTLYISLIASTRAVRRSS